jgi:uncharacterized protein YehS (DUF1456 family)
MITINIDDEEIEKQLKKEAEETAQLLDNVVKAYLNKILKQEKDEYEKSYQESLERSLRINKEVLIELAKK